MLFMKTKPGQAYRVDLGIAGKVRLMFVVCRDDHSRPRALTICVPITASSRNSDYEVELPKVPFLSKKSYANVQGIQAIQDHELSKRPAGTFRKEVLEKVRDALRFALEL